ncbi:excisionase [Halalkalibacter akibai]|uniref:DNA binding protein n=1 Tax=Halalkalibacter akibai (strain ATCC 43226 / DSM 21942 / CIP 109018 / JCM 9157 / 1139) TaxID=1236973 RepID=W4QYA9_HALA3|nr:excisionase [Halalkalibacter akibai]GAE36643.1 DNA binding protein [Halalkalibacter akibai JCM 9157]
MSQRTVNDYPIILKAEHISEIIGCSKRVAYELMEQADFPLVRMGRLKRVERDAFFTWFKVQSNKSNPNHEGTIDLWQKRYRTM